MKRLLASCYVIAFWVLYVFADVYDHGRPWDVDDNYDNNRGIWFVLFIIVIGVIAFIGTAVKHTWDNHKDSIKEGLGIVALFGVFILLFLGGKACSEQYPKDNGNDINVNQIQEKFLQTSQPQHIKDNYIYQEPSKDHPVLKYRSEEYYETCMDCQGTGIVSCYYCNGSGWLRSTCSFCDGTGGRHRVRCISCILNEQSVSPSSSNCIECGNTGYVDTYCIRCNGSGYESSMCTHCDINKHQMRCNTCNGNGRMTRTRQVPYYE